MPMLGKLHATTTPDHRTFVVGTQAYLLLQRAGITPPPVGQQYDVAQLDAKLSAAGLDVSERVFCKNALRSVGLLAEGRALTERG